MVQSRRDTTVFLLVFLYYIVQVQLLPVFSSLQIYNQWIQNSDVISCSTPTAEDPCIEIAKSDIKNEFGVRAKEFLENGTTILQVYGTQMIDPYYTLHLFKSYKKQRIKENPSVSDSVSELAKNFSSFLINDSLEKLIFDEVTKTLKDFHSFSKENERKIEASNERSLYQIFEQLPPHSASSLAVLLLHLVHTSGSASYYYPWIRILPQHTNNAFLWSEEELSLIKGSPLYEEAKKQQKLVNETFSWLDLNFFSKNPREFPPKAFTFSKYQWAMSIISSRSFVIERSDDFPTARRLLIPFADMFNHAPTSTASVSSLSSAGKLTKTAGAKLVPSYYSDSPFRKISNLTSQFYVEISLLRPHEPGEEIYINYGKLSNSELLLKYGFIVPNNTEDSFQFKVRASFQDLQCSIEFEDKIADYVPPFSPSLPIVQLLREQHFTKFKHLSIDDNFSSVFNSLRWLRLLNLQLDDLKRLENTESNGGVIGLENELNAIRGFISLLNHRLDQFSTMYGTRNTERVKLAMELRDTEIKILKSAIGKLRFLWGFILQSGNFVPSFLINEECLKNYVFPVIPNESDEEAMIPKDIMASLSMSFYDMIYKFRRLEDSSNIVYPIVDPLSNYNLSDYTVNSFRERDPIHYSNIKMGTEAGELVMNDISFLPIFANHFHLSKLHSKSYSELNIQYPFYQYPNNLTFAEKSKNRDLDIIASDSLLHPEVSVLSLFTFGDVPNLIPSFTLTSPLTYEVSTLSTSFLSPTSFSETSILSSQSRSPHSSGIPLKDSALSGSGSGSSDSTIEGVSPLFRPLNFTDKNRSESSNCKYDSTTDITNEGLNTQKIETSVIDDVSDTHVVKTQQTNNTLEEVEEEEDTVIDEVGEIQQEVDPLGHILKKREMINIEQFEHYNRTSEKINIALLLYVSSRHSKGELNDALDLPFIKSLLYQFLKSLTASDISKYHYRFYLAVEKDDAVYDKAENIQPLWNALEIIHSKYKSAVEFEFYKMDFSNIDPPTHLNIGFEINEWIEVEAINRLANFAYFDGFDYFFYVNEHTQLKPKSNWTSLFINQLKSNAKAFVQSLNLPEEVFDHLPSTGNNSFNINTSGFGVTSPYYVGEEEEDKSKQTQSSTFINSELPSQYFVHRSHLTIFGSFLLQTGSPMLSKFFLYFEYTPFNAPVNSVQLVKDSDNPPVILRNINSALQSQITSQLMDLCFDLQIFFSSRLSLSCNWNCSLVDRYFPMVLEIQSQALDFMNPKSLFSHTDPLSKKLQEVVRKDDPYNLVLVTFTNFAFINFTRNWYAQVRHLKIENYIIFALDKYSYEYLTAANLTTFYDEEFSASPFEQRYLEGEYRKVVNLKTKYIFEILTRGCSPLVSDVDIVFLSNPLPDLEKGLPFYDLQIQSESTNNATAEISYTSPEIYLNTLSSEQGVVRDFTKLRPQLSLNTGFQLLKSSYKTIRFYQNILDFQRNYPDFQDQRAYNILFNQIYYSYLHYRVLDKLQYPNGWIFFNLFLPQKLNVRPTIIHNNWLIGSSSKIHRFREEFIWYLDPMEYYNHPSLKFFMYKMSDLGIKKQSEELLIALVLSHMLNRTLILPKVYTPPSWKENGMNEYLTVENLFEIERIESLNITFRASSFPFHPIFKRMIRNNQEVFYSSPLVVNLISSKTDPTQDRSHPLSHHQNENGAIKFSRTLNITSPNDYFSFKEIIDKLKSVENEPFLVFPSIRELFGLNIAKYPNIEEFVHAVRLKGAPNLLPPD